MKIQPVASPHAVQQANTNTQAQADAKARAIAKITGGAPTSTPTEVFEPQVPVPVNANNVSPEEVSAVKAPTDQNVNTEATEPTDTQQAPPPPQEDPLSKQYAQLARREKQLRQQKHQQDQVLRAKEQELRAKEEALAAKEQEYKNGYIAKSRLKNETLDVFAEEGLTYEEITAKQLEQAGINPQVKAHISRLEAQIQRLTEATESSKKAQETQQQESYKAAVNQIRADANKLINNSGEQYEAIRSTSSQRDVVSLVESVFKDGLLKPNARHDKDWQYEPGTVISVEEAADMVEEHLMEEIDRLNKIQKVQKKYKQASTPGNTTPAQQTQTTTQQPQIKTLTNNIGSTKKMTNRERAIAAAEGRLKS